MSDDAPAPLTIADAEEMLDGLPLVPVMAGSIADIKRLRDRCLAEGIAAIAAAPAPGRG